ncbi:hypothetical protein [Croceivirga thetidis]|uniref:Lipoprotein n=1 Tax=Croceivirga thetidis TaxID=2721623 RepID=A0ABX1GTW3_9FLAO|nr:hypothetical protein [Croceivirga thetidis]NKI33392.1 hypothetical protein [Croceivirga thetidis]
MKSSIYYLLLFFCVFFYSCGPAILSSIKKENESLRYDSDITILELDEKIPEDAEVLGEAKLRGGFDSRCSKMALIDLAKVEARRVGGNFIKITKDKSPDFWDSCHRLNITIIRKTD